MRTAFVAFCLSGLLAACASSQSEPDQGSSASLENTYWKLMRLGDTDVIVGPGQREPQITLQPAQKRVTGSGGCNTLAGSYTLDGEQLTFGQMISTKMACAQGMDQETAFHEALARVARWRIVGERLELLDATGKPVAQFESRYMK